MKNSKGKQKERVGQLCEFSRQNWLIIIMINLRQGIRKRYNRKKTPYKYARLLLPEQTLVGYSKNNEFQRM
jgi:hypothetical protein